MAETETIDKLFLELSQCTRARTKKEVDYEQAIRFALYHLNDVTRNGPAVKAIMILRKAIGRIPDSDVRDPHPSEES
jgi:hypothetical protein